MEQTRNKKQAVLKRALTSGSLNVKKLGDNLLLPPTPSNGVEKDRNEDDRFYPESSGEEDDETYDDDDDDDEMCILLESGDDDDDDEGLSGLHINLKTLQAVSSMLAHYVPIIQSDIYGNPRFVPPPPPSEEEYYNEQRRKSTRKPASRTPSRTPKRVTQEGDDYQYAIQELEDVLLAQDNPNLSDAMNDLTDVMEKISRFTEDLNKEG